MGADTIQDGFGEGSIIAYIMLFPSKMDPELEHH